MMPKLIFDTFYNGQDNIFTEEVYGYAMKKIIGNYYLVVEKSKANVLFDTILYCCSTLLYNEDSKEILKIDLSKSFETKQEVEDYISSIDMDTVYNADWFEPVKSLTYEENLEILKLEE